MKSFRNLMLSMLLVTSASMMAQNQGKATVTVRLNEIDKNSTTPTKLYLIQEGEKNKTLDSVALTADKNTHTFTITAAKSDFYRIRINQTNVYVSFVSNPGDKLEITSTASVFRKNLEVKGSEKMVSVYSFYKTIRSYDLKLDSIETIYRKTTENNQEFPQSLSDEYDRIEKEQKTKILEYIKTNKQNLEVMYIADYASMDDDLESFIEIDAALYPKYNYLYKINEQHRKIETAKKLSVGAVAPEISLPDPSGKVISLSSFRGKVIIVDFWASWCSPCRKENPNMIKAYETYKDKGLEILSVSLDKNKDSWIKAIADDKLTWTMISDLKAWQSQAARDYNVEAIPYTILIDKEGKIIAKGLRGEKLQEKLAELLNK